MTTETIPDQRAEAIAAEERWVAWIARGREDDRQLKKRAVVGAVAIAVLVALGLFFTR